MRVVNSAPLQCPHPGSQSWGRSGSGQEGSKSQGHPAHPQGTRPTSWKCGTSTGLLPQTWLAWLLLTLHVGSDLGFCRKGKLRRRGPTLSPFKPINGVANNLANRAARTGPVEDCHSALSSKLELPPVSPRPFFDLFIHAFIPKY